MLQFAKHLPAHAIEVCMLTHRGRAALDPNEAHGVYAALDSTRWLMELLQKSRSAPGSRAAAGAAPRTGAAPREGWRLNDLRARARRFMLPDRASFAWAPFAFALGAQVFAREKPQLVLSSSPPMAAHVVAAALAARFGVPWIADVRDGYAFEAPEGPSPLRALRRSFERQLYGRAARLITVTDVLRDDFRSFLPLPPEHVITLTNGFDAELFSATSPSASGAEWTVLYAGSSTFRSGQNLANLLRGIDRFAQHAACEVRARLMGLFGAGEIPPLSYSQIDLTGWRSRQEVVSSMLAADVLVVLTGNHRSVATTKLFEYIGASRPILVIGRDSAAARIVLEHGLGLACDDDAQSIARALEELFDTRAQWRERLASEAAREVRMRFSRQGQAAMLAQHIDALI